MTADPEGASPTPPNPSVSESLAPEDGRADAVTKVGVTALVCDKAGRVLLGRKGRAFDPAFVDKWVTPGGRVNYGETLQAAISREVREETGLDVAILEALAPQELIHPKGHYVFFAFVATQLDPAIVPRAGDDLGDVRWFTADELRATRDAMTPLTRAIIDDYLASAGTEAGSADAIHAISDGTTVELSAAAWDRMNARVRVLEGALAESQAVIAMNAEIIHAGHTEESWEVCTTPRCKRLRGALAEPRDARAPHNTEA